MKLFNSDNIFDEVIAKKLEGNRKSYFVDILFSLVLGITGNLLAFYLHRGGVF